MLVVKNNGFESIVHRSEDTEIVFELSLFIQFESINLKAPKEPTV